jgi:hypothetical protein
VCRPGSTPNTAPISVTDTSTLWCARNNGSALRLSHPLGNTGRISSTRPICAAANAKATAVGGLRFDRVPGTPTALIGKPPYRTRST